MKAKFFQLLEEMNKADPRFTVYAKALLFYYMPNQGELFITHNWYIADLLGIHENTLLKAKKELVTRGVIFVDPAYSGKENNRRSGTYVTVNYDWKASNNPHLNKLIQNKVIENKVIENKVIENKVIENKLIQKGALIREKDLHREKDLPRENDPQGKDLTREKAEGAAAKPQPAPALSVGAENVPEKSAAQNAPGAASQESSFPETAQGQQNGNKYQIPLTVPEVMEQGPRDLWGEPERVPEKPKKKPKGKGKAAGKAKFTPPTLEEVIADIEIKLEKKGKREFWTSDQIRNFADDFMEHYTDPAINWTNKYGDPIQSWRLTLATWLKNVDYLPPERTTRNQPQREGKQIFTAEQLEKLAAGNTDPQQILEQRRERENQKGNVITIE